MSEVAPLVQHSATDVPHCFTTDHFLNAPISGT
jgi:hypothetical protein